MINQNQIKGIIGNTIKEDILSLQKNSLSVNSKSETKDFTNITNLTEIFNMSNILNTIGGTSVISCSINIKNKNSIAIPFKITSLGSVLHEGNIDAGKVMAFSSQRSDLVISIGGNCTLTYSIKSI
ncbi:hypothetical protein AR9_g194 [Bacillus phage AR9]|uniref:Uncharacterized protein n=2 Tax=Bacillus phage PBS1 TaxID=10683 RepID=A0A172JI99_BPPB1|nr:hypothetical protein BI022_gp193 [Bacillus phage AR9]YP_009664286.1 hypothetical protein FK780_gp084 [Bacillus phage PBS1]PTU25925.1 hypothetical protein DA469_21235 [Bacillus subtilis]WCS68320.1 hypothetical protein Goe21_02100 [Bacillus phage vB_BsuM-Goe21]AMS01278.1 hypothetical protein AR9_g194 [Bacillus phage AR9]AST99906.1 hypothetical protein PBI_PBS1_84 [Bacillus phage PBS1]BDE75274.1 hypothetical protein [Bacillus phage PBS1]